MLGRPRSKAPVRAGAPQPAPQPAPLPVVPVQSRWTEQSAAFDDGESPAPQARLNRLPRL